jgi:hypothetical protein
MSFATRLEIREVNEDNTLWELTTPLVYKGNTQVLVAPIGLKTNFASVPKMFWSVLAPWGRHMKAAVMHDYFYQTGCISRLDADGLFYRMMRQLGVSWWRRQTMYRMVRLFGSKYYKN